MYPLCSGVFYHHCSSNTWLFKASESYHKYRTVKRILTWASRSDLTAGISADQQSHRVKWKQSMRFPNSLSKSDISFRKPQLWRSKYQLLEKQFTSCSYFYSQLPCSSTQHKAEDPSQNPQGEGSLHTGEWVRPTKLCRSERPTWPDFDYLEHRNVDLTDVESRIMVTYRREGIERLVKWV